MMEPRGDPLSPATQEAEVARRIHEASTGNAQVVQENSKPDTTYEREWKHFKTFVDTGRAEKKLLPGDKYLTHQNVDLYFSLVISKYAVVPDSARRVISSLQWFSNTYEHTLDKFEVGSPEVLLALKAQMQHYGNKIAALIVDPHANLPTDVLSDEDYDRAYDTILKRINWEDLHLSWTTCVVRQAQEMHKSFRKTLSQTQHMNASGSISKHLWIQEEQKKSFYLVIST